MGGDKGRKGEEGTKRREEGKRKKGTYIYKMKRSSPIPNTHTHMYTYRLRTGVCCLILHIQTEVLLASAKN